jgi:hypothetical protein
MRVTFNGNDLGGTADGVSLSIHYESAPIMVDQFGKTEIDRKVSGQSYRVKMTLAEIKNKDKVKVVLPSAHEISSGGNKMIYSDMQVGDSLLGHAAVLLLHPLEASDTDLSEDYKFFKAVCIGATEVKYGPDKQSGMALEFVVFPDTGVSPARFMIYGDPSIGIVNAAAGAAVAGSNTGNGTVSGITANNNYTRTETITLLCVGVPGTNRSNWYVSGSVSGALGQLQISSTGAGSSAAFNSNPIAFSVVDGSTDFVIGDSFTISTTASNYA